MPPKPRYLSSPKDDLAWEKSDKVAEEWERELQKNELLMAIGALILKYRPGEALQIHRPIRGGYNVCYRMEYKDGSSVAMRVPCKGIMMESPLTKYEI
jgi:hypothetical protein